MVGGCRQPTAAIATARAVMEGLLVRTALPSPAPVSAPSVSTSFILSFAVQLSSPPGADMMVMMMIRSSSNSTTTGPLLVDC